MSGQLPNPNARRQNRSGAFIQLPAEGREGPVPDLPATYSAGPKARPKFRDETRAAWVAWWRSPMATEWDDAADLPAITRMAVLTDQALRGNATGVELRELRMLEDRFGLSPKARRALRWTVDAGDDGTDDRVVRLHVVDDENDQGVGDDGREAADG